MALLGTLIFRIEDRGSFLAKDGRITRWPRNMINAMWPFKRKSPTPVMVPPEQISFSQADITEHFGDDQSLSPDEWIQTTPLNTGVPNPQAQGLPPVGATDEEVYRVAEVLSEIRESIPVPNDGVYCPVCHIANVTLSLLRTPCPKCNRPLLKFGWD